jgi:hypothetical protein
MGVCAWLPTQLLAKTFVRWIGLGGRGASRQFPPLELAPRHDLFSLVARPGPLRGVERLVHTGGTPVGFNVGVAAGEAGSTLPGIDLVGGRGVGCVTLAGRRAERQRVRG